MTAQDQIKTTVTENDVVLFMKGTKSMPQCGFSSRVAGVLNFMGVEYQDVNVLADEAIRQGIKHGAGVSILSPIAVSTELENGDLAALSIEGVDLRRRFYLTWAKARTPSPLAATLGQYLKHFFRSDSPRPSRPGASN